jgi:hypothetical protein
VAKSCEPSSYAPTGEQISLIAAPAFAALGGGRLGGVTEARAGPSGVMVNLTAAIAMGETHMEPLVAAVRERQRQRIGITQELQSNRERLHRPKLDRRRIAQARLILRTLLPERLVFTPRLGEGHPYYEFSGRGALDRLLAGIIDIKGVVAQRNSTTMRVRSSWSLRAWR